FDAESHLLSCVFYGDLFRPKGSKSKSAEKPYRPTDVSSDFEQELLQAWWQEAARTDPGVPSPESSVKARTPEVVQRALRCLMRSKFFAGISLRAMIGDLKQVSAYLLNDNVRLNIQDRVAKAIDSHTSVVIGHSLGSVIAYEALCAHPEWPVRVL